MMRDSSRKLAATLLLLCCMTGQADPPVSIEERVQNLQHMRGFYDLYWDQAQGKLLLGIDRFAEEFLYQSSMPSGVGSNDLGLDRGELGSTRVTRFYRSGSRVLLIADNLGYRADTANPAERRAVQESFAESVLWGFEVVAETDGAVLVDATDFFLRDSHFMSLKLERAKQGDYTPDESRSAIFLQRTRSFPDNTEVEAIVTFTGKPNYDAPEGHVLSTVTPDPGAVTVHLHHSFIRLPDDGFEAVAFDPRSGYIGAPGWGTGYLDFGSEIGEPLHKMFIARHRLQKKNPAAPVSEPVEPIVYYLDPGAPEPVRSALLEGAGWWNQAFEAAGYRDAFQVRMLPEDADPMDVRYNVIQWVHRSTRGWSYGSSVLDPRTGEILKGHVTLGSLRVRQDYLIAEGLLSPYGGEARDDRMLEMSLARIRQLAAHEVGHTIGLEHNFAGSVNDRASVMDYPFPLVRFDEAGRLDLSQAYGKGIGEWDKRAILFGYQHFPEDVDADEARVTILRETLASGLLFVADEDARDPGTAHPHANLWDNGADSVEELQHLARVRAHALENFSLNNIRRGRPAATLEEVLVPIYLLHRYQVQAAGKLLGGSWFSYDLRGDGQSSPRAVGAADQRRAMTALLETLTPEFLELPAGLNSLISPRPPGFPLDRETFPRRTGVTFDPLAPAAAASRLTLDVLLNEPRLQRMNRQHATEPGLPDAAWLIGQLLESAWQSGQENGMAGLVRRETQRQVLDRLSLLAQTPGGDVRAQARAAIEQLDGWLQGQQRKRVNEDWGRHYAAARADIAAVLRAPVEYQPAEPPQAPPGSPIGG